MQDPNKSPAVQSLKIEQEAQRERASEGNLEIGIEDTFPASDPVAATQAAVSTGRIDAEEANRVRQQPEGNEEFPLVEQALRSTEAEYRCDEEVTNGRDRLRALRRDANHLAETASEMAAGATSLAKSEVRSLLQDVETKIRDRPISAIAIVAGLAFVFGATR
ncbi:ElaB/YqjD/DUF883 family membrane-anchored ribosome-binding protein [Pararhizobium capsulatum DSM 1112]|uniref:ElaB/YqjD/DUF883 family membrane-anchored ribosome-binding protein n=1 Tax=Pararhizobium capsulatum DSM 1112 TaxID=1121113 RepID=A0ABU0BZA9_9HYPH|nr:hypothetical protein [Pararhizobium capsulatum]MDQ0323579.1 ElaB/YqjD/DUF883 family membrane-anchored ribosome-binding protein [Pararhizobium capsulatum DSM 1112]